jgi:hypothetical protein
VSTPPVGDATVREATVREATVREATVREATVRGAARDRGRRRDAGCRVSGVPR